MVEAVPHLVQATHWEVGQNNTLKAVSDKRNIFFRLGSWLTGASKPQKVFQQFKVLIEASPVRAEDLYRYKQDIEKEYPGSYASTTFGRIADTIWRGGVLGAKEAALDATYSKLDRLFFGEQACYDSLASAADRTQRRLEIDQLYQLTASKDSVELEEFDQQLAGLPQTERGPWLQKFADLGYPGAQLAMAKLLRIEEAPNYGLAKDDRAALDYTIRWTESQGGTAATLFRLAKLKKGAGAEHMKVVDLLSAAISQTSPEDAPHILRLRGTLKLELPNPADQLSGWRDLLQAANAGDPLAAREIRDRGMDSLLRGQSSVSASWGGAFKAKNQEAVDQLNEAIWAHTASTPEDRGKALFLRAKISLESPVDERKLAAWRDICDAAALESPDALDFADQVCAQASAKGVRMIISEEEFVEEFVRAHDTEMHALNSRLWMAAAGHAASGAVRRSFLKNAASLGSLEAAQQLKESSGDELIVYYLKTVLSKQPTGSAEYGTALDELQEIASHWAQGAAKRVKGAALLLELAELGHERSRVVLASIGLSAKPELLEGITPIDYPPAQVQNYIIGQMLGEGILLRENRLKAIGYFTQAPEIPLSLLLAAHIHTDKQEAVRLLAPLLVAHGPDTQLGREAREVLKAYLPFPLSQPVAQPGPSDSSVVLARTVLYAGGLRLWNAPSKGIFQTSLKVSTPVPSDPEKLKAKVEVEEISVVADLMQRMFEVLKPRLLSEQPGQLSPDRQELFNDCLLFLHSFAQLSPGTGMDARALALAWGPALFSAPLTEGQIAQLTGWIQEGSRWEV